METWGLSNQSGTREILRGAPGCARGTDRKKASWLTWRNVGVGGDGKYRFYSFKNQT